VVVLTNVFTQAGVEDLGFHLLDSDSPLLPADSPLLRPPSAHTEITLDSAILDKYVGRYQFLPEMFMRITRKDGQLSAQLTGQGFNEIYPESKTSFFYRVVDAQIIFQTDTKDRVNGLVLRQLGIDRLTKRLGGDADPIEEWFGHREKPVDRSVLDNYVGQYQITGV